MVSFVWSSKYPFLAGAGGSENYTAGHVRELIRRGIPARIVTIGFGTNDGRDSFPDIPFLALESKDSLSDLDDTLIFVTYPLNVRTRHPAYAILHCPPPSHTRDTMYDPRGFKGKRLIATSKYASRLWRGYTASGMARVATVYPFADQAFGTVKRTERRRGEAPRILFAGRLDPEKGIYTLLAAMHMQNLKDAAFTLTVTEAGSHSDDGKILLPMLRRHPRINIVPAKCTAGEMADLMADHDVVVMPSTSIFWQETFGMVSVEAQHAGCRVVGSRSGGLPETNCGGLLLVEPDNPKALAQGMAKAFELGPLTARERAVASRKFTVEASVDALLGVLTNDLLKLRRKVSLHGDGVRLPRLQPQLARFGDRLMQSSYLNEFGGGNLNAGLKN